MSVTNDGTGPKRWSVVHSPGGGTGSFLAGSPINA